MSFDKSIEFVKLREGGYSNNPKDPGGETNFGICKRAYPDLNIKDLTWEQAKAIYKKDYWDVMHCQDMPEDIAHLVLDFGVNSGPANAIKILQKALNNYDNSLTVDGVIGPKTIAACKKCMHTPDMCADMLDLRIDFYVDLVIAKPAMLSFLRGWINRVKLNRKFILDNY